MYLNYIYFYLDILCQFQSKVRVPKNRVMLSFAFIRVSCIAEHCTIKGGVTVPQSSRAIVREYWVISFSVGVECCSTLNGSSEQWNLLMCKHVLYSIKSGILQLSFFWDFKCKENIVLQNLVKVITKFKLKWQSIKQWIFNHIISESYTVMFYEFMPRCTLQVLTNTSAIYKPGP